MDDSIVCCCHNLGTSAPFEMAWKAIEDGDFSELKQAIKKMKESEDGSSAPLDTCCLIKKSGVTYSMNLLALCGFHENLEMVNLLLGEGADMKAECVCKIHTGTTVLQMMFHCFNQKEHGKLSTTILEHFIKREANLGGKISTRHFDHDGSDSGGVNYGILHLPLEMQRIDCAKMFVEAGVEPINGGTCIGEEFEVVQMFEEYRLNGTNMFIRWAFNEYIPNHPEVDLKRIIHSLINMKKKDENSCFWQFVQRAPAHAILTSHHEETIKRLIQCGKENDLDLLDERSCTGKTALHVAAENNDVESVHILLRLGADMRTFDNSGMNPFMLAVEKSHLKVVKAMIKKDPDFVSLPMGCGSTAIHWALEEGYSRSAFFKGFIEENPEALLTAEDFQRNTVAHLVAASGNTEVFEMLWSEKFAKTVFSGRNLEGKTPLQLAVEKGHVNILKTLKTRVDGGREAEQRETKPPLWLRRLKTEWRNEMVTSFLYASSCGSLDAFKYLLASQQKPDISHNDKTPLLCAAKAGHVEIVAYLLQFKSVLTYLEEQPEEILHASASPLLMAAQNGHTKCVTLLLQNGSNVLQRDLEDRNCLMMAIQNHHKATALAILACEDGLKALKRNKNPSPLQLMVKDIPDLAEYVLNKCITQTEPKQVGTDGQDDPDAKEQPVKYNFDYLVDSKRQTPPKHHDYCTDEPGSTQQTSHIDGEDCINNQQDHYNLIPHKHIDGLPKQQIVIDGDNDVDGPTATAEKPHDCNLGDQNDKDRQILHNDHSNHILDWMVDNNRLELLQHPLVENFLCQKFWSTAFPLLLLNLLFYLTLLVALNLFVLVVPRPGPDSETCPESDVATFNGTSSGCQGQNGSRLWFLATTAFLLYTLCILGFLMEVVQLVERKRKYFEDSDNYFQLALYISTIIFIHGFDNECWCSTPWQWQIGALAVFLSWFNFIFILKYMSYTAIPINMFLSICVKFLKMIFLPIVLILAFGVPHYMVFVRTKKEESLPAFKSSGHAIAKTLLQLAGEFDFEDTFNRGDLLYSPTTYILFLTFLITMPILFINLLNALAVGETQEITKNAELTTLKLQVELIQEQWGMEGLLTFLERLGINRPQFIQYITEYRADDGSSHSSTHSPINPKHSTRSSKHYFQFVLTLLGSGYCKYVLGKDYPHHAKIAKECKKRNEDIYNEVMAQNPVREDITKLNEDISTFKQEMMAQNPVREDITKLNEDISTFKQEMMAQNPVREDITKLNKDISTFKQEMMAQKDDIAKLKEDMAKLVQALTPSGGN